MYICSRKADAMINILTKKTFWVTIAAMAFMACSSNESSDADSTVIDVHQKAKGDSAIYGLACEGCNDSVIVFLPNSGGDPDTFDIVNARREHRVYGRPSIGNELSVILNPEDKDEAMMVINIEDLKGKWCYKVMPKMRVMEAMPKKMQRRMMANMPDSMRKTLLVPREVGYDLHRNNVVRSIGIRPSQADEESPVEYPPFTRYRSWRLYNGKVIFDKDTATIALMMRDSLLLDFGDHQQAFYRK